MSIRTPEEKARADARHLALWDACLKKPEDYTPYGQLERWADPKAAYPDCSCGCKFFAPLHDGPEDEEGWADADWGVCTNSRSHRVGLLTFEHQGCQAFKPEKD